MTKNSSSGNIILRNNRRSYLDSNRGEMKQFYSLVNVNAPKNNKIQNEEKKIENHNNSKGKKINFLIKINFWKILKIKFF